MKKHLTEYTLSCNGSYTIFRTDRQSAVIRRFTFRAATDAELQGMQGLKKGNVAFMVQNKDCLVLAVTDIVDIDGKVFLVGYATDGERYALPVFLITETEIVRFSTKAFREMLLRYARLSKQQETMEAEQSNDPAEVRRLAVTQQQRAGLRHSMFTETQGLKDPLMYKKLSGRVS